jgi:membrane-associated phospholipid phosphatase
MKLALRSSLLLAVAFALRVVPAAGAETAPPATDPETSAPATGAAPPTAAAPAALAGAPAPGQASPASKAPSEPPALYHFEPGVVCPMCKVTPEYPEGREGLHWHDHWESVGTREYVTIAALAAGVLGMQLFIPGPSKARWTSPILFDEPVRNALRFGSEASRQTASNISDVLIVWETVQTTLIDPLVFAWWQRDAPEVAKQMMVIDAQAYGMTLLVNGIVKRLTARARPWAVNADCENNPGGSECGHGDPNVSFYSGHAAITATSAGLLCAHHTQLSLYQNNVLDGGMCILAVTGTVVTGLLRISSDNHWATDVLTGHLLGYASGYLLPTLLYYKEFRTSPHEHTNAPSYAALPMITADTLGVSLFGVF